MHAARIRHAPVDLDLPKRKFVLDDARRDLSVHFHGHTAATPFGPATPAGLCGGLVGARVFVSDNDRATWQAFNEGLPL